MQLLEKTFKLKEHKTTVLTEVVGGITTFFAMAYIIFVNPNFLSQTGMDHTAVMLATCISAAIGSLLTAFLANVPFAQAPGMGLNAFFTYTICFGMGYTWQQGLAIVFISGLIFLAVTVSPLRSKIIASIPASLKAAISAGIGLFICLIGLLNAGIVTAGNNLLDLSNRRAAAGADRPAAHRRADGLEGQGRAVHRHHPDHADRHPHGADQRIQHQHQL